MSEYVEIKDLLSKAIRHRPDCNRHLLHIPMRKVDQQVFRMRVEGYTMRECGKAVGLSPSRVMQIEAKYKTRLKHILMHLGGDWFRGAYYSKSRIAASKRNRLTAKLEKQLNKFQGKETTAKSGLAQ